jgi:hypothetical protein
VRGRTRNKCFTDLSRIYFILLYNYDGGTKQRGIRVLLPRCGVYNHVYLLHVLAYSIAITICPILRYYVG